MKNDKGLMAMMDRLKLGIQKHGYNSEFRKEYDSLCKQLRYNELDKFFDKWERISKIKILIKVWENYERKRRNNFFIPLTTASTFQVIYINPPPFLFLTPRPSI